MSTNEYNEKAQITIPLKSKFSTIKFEMWDWDRLTSDDFLCSVILTAKEI